MKPVQGLLCSPKVIQKNCGLLPGIAYTAVGKSALDTAKFINGFPRT